MGTHISKALKAAIFNFVGGIANWATPQNATRNYDINSVAWDIGDSAGDASHEQADIIVPRAGTLKNFYARVTATGHNFNQFTVRKNGANTDIDFIITGVGTDNDTTHPVAVVAGDRICLAVGTSDDGGSTTCSWGIEFV